MSPHRPSVTLWNLDLVLAVSQLRVGVSPSRVVDRVRGNTRGLKFLSRRIAISCRTPGNHCLINQSALFATLQLVDVSQAVETNYCRQRGPAFVGTRDR